MKKVQCCMCGKPVKVPDCDENALHFCGHTKDADCVVEYWRRLHEKYKTE